ncbi:MAG: hypothetical protein ACRDQU_20150 [Pseudonocardiaceae bacterium]
MRDDIVTTSPCPVCGTGFLPVRRQRFCSPACRQTAYRRRHPIEPTVPIPDGRPRREITVYTCPECDQRYLAQQWCHDCNRPCTRIGYGGPCPHCEEPVTVDDLLPEPPR